MALFQDLGNSPLEIELLMIEVRGMMMTSIADFNILVETKSSPELVLLFTLINAFLTSDSLTVLRAK